MHPYHAATSIPSHRICLRSALYNLPDTAWFESDIVTNAFAFTRSMIAKNNVVGRGYSLEFGSNEKIGRRRGAFPLIVSNVLLALRPRWGGAGLVPGGRLLRHTGTHCECKEKALPALSHPVSCAIPILNSSALDCKSNLRLLKLFTGVDTSTLPVNKPGKEGKRTMSRIRSARAPANTTALDRKSVV